MKNFLLFFSILFSWFLSIQVGAEMNYVPTSQGVSENVNVQTFGRLHSDKTPMYQESGLDSILDLLGKFIALFIPLTGIAILIGSVIFWFRMFVHAIVYPIPDKVLWVVVIFFLPLFGAILYYFLIKQKYKIPLVSNEDSSSYQKNIQSGDENGTTQKL